MNDQTQRQFDILHRSRQRGLSGDGCSTMMSRDRLWPSHIPRSIWRLGLGLILAIIGVLWTLRQAEQAQAVAALARAWHPKEMVNRARLDAPDEQPLAPPARAGESASAPVSIRGRAVPESAGGSRQRPVTDLGQMPDLASAMPLTATLGYTIYLPVVPHDCLALRPDLMIVHVAFDTPNIVAGQPFLLNVTVYNQGAGDTSHSGVAAWFTVEVYIKDRAFTPPGPPADVLDHAGGFCSDGSPNCETGTQQPAHLVFVGGLRPGESKTATYTLTFPNSDLYDLYIQVDTTWQAPGYTGRPWGQHQEEDESNNIFAVEDILVPAGQ
jgi:hypothetical protein